MDNLTVYVNSNCGACHVQLPKIKEYSAKLGVSLEVVDIDRCPVKHKDKCSSLEWVPTLVYNGREIEVSDLEKMARGK